MWVYLVRLGDGRWTRADAAALLALAPVLGLLRSLLAMLPTRFDVTSFAGIVCAPFDCASLKCRPRVLGGQTLFPRADTIPAPLRQGYPVNFHVDL
jgi:hypothetical protein